MDELIISIISERDYINKELTLIIKTCVSLNLSNKNSEILFKYMVPAIYANWERFLKNSIKYQIIYLNNLSITSKDLGYDILTVIADENNIFEKNFKDFNNRKKAISAIYSIITSPKIKEDKPKHSNLNFIESNKILSIYKLPLINEKYKAELNKLVKFRTFIAHGDDISTNFDMNLIRNFVFLVEDLMDDFIFNLI